MFQTDALIIGAGPVGLFQVFELGLQGIHAHVVDVLPHVGGQCVQLYADKPIYDIPGLPHCTGRELVERLSLQAAPFKPEFHLGQQVSHLERQADGRFLVETTQGHRFLTKTLFIASGVGAFVPRSLALEGLESFHQRQVFHQPNLDQNFSDQHVVIAGSDAMAVESALHLAYLPKASAPASVTLVHRRRTLDVEPHVTAQWDAACQPSDRAVIATFRVGQITGFHQQNDRLAALNIATPDGETIQQACDQLWILLGLSPKLGPITQWGLALERKQLVVDTDGFQTSEAGVFAVGDCNTYPGKRKLIVSGFHEATLAAFAAAAYLHPGKKIPLEYTTASPRLHALLNVR